MNIIEVAQLSRFAAEKIMGWEQNTNMNSPYYGCWMKGSLKVYDSGGWHPEDGDSNQIWMIIDKMHEFGYTFSFYRFVGPIPYIAKFMKIYEYRGEDENPCIAILLAAKAALETK